MEEEQLNGLALLYAHRDKEVPSDKIFEDCENESSATESSFIILKTNDYNPAKSRPMNGGKSDICRFCDLI